MVVDSAEPAAPPNRDLELPPSAYPVRPLVQFSECSADFDWQRVTSWKQHQHVGHVEITVAGKGAVGVARWRPRNGRPLQSDFSGDGIWIVPAGVSHGGDWLRAAGRISLYVRSSLVMRLTGREIKQVSIAPLRRYETITPLIAELCAELWKECRLPHTAEQFTAGGMAQALAGHILRAHFAPTRGEDSLKWQFLRTSLADVRAYVEENISEDLSLEVLARVADLSPSYFGQLFRAAIGLPPLIYVTGARVRRAKELLRGGEHSATVVAHMAGFSTQQQMNVSFRRTLNTVPSDYLPGGEKNRIGIENTRKHVRWRFC